MMAQSIKHNEYTGSSLIDLAEPPAVVTKEPLLEIVQGFDWLLDHKIDKQRIANDLLALYKPKDTAERDRLGGLCLMYLSTVMYEAAKYAAQSQEANKNKNAHNGPHNNTIKISHFNGESSTEFVRRDSDGRWQLCRVGDKGTVSIQDISWYDAEIRVKEALTEHSVLREVVSVLNEDKKYLDEDKIRVAADIIDAIAREVA